MFVYSKIVVRIYLFLVVASLSSCFRNEMSLKGVPVPVVDSRITSLKSGRDGTGYMGTSDGRIFKYGSYPSFLFQTEGKGPVYDIFETVLAGDTSLFIGIRNSGLEKWTRKDGKYSYAGTYTIPYKKERYSPYEIHMKREYNGYCPSDIFYMATSNGLYVADPFDSKKEALLVYPDSSLLSSYTQRDFPIRNICESKGVFFIPSKRGIIVFKDGRVIFRIFRDRSFKQIFRTNDTLYALGGDSLYVFKGIKFLDKRYAPDCILSSIKKNGGLLLLSAGSLYVYKEKKLKRYSLEDLSAFTNEPGENHIFLDIPSKNSVWIASGKGIVSIYYDKIFPHGSENKYHAVAACKDISSGKIYFYTSKKDLLLFDPKSDSFKFICHISGKNEYGKIYVRDDSLYLLSTDIVASIRIPGRKYLPVKPKIIYRGREIKGLLPDISSGRLFFWSRSGFFIIRGIDSNEKIYDGYISDAFFFKNEEGNNLILLSTLGSGVVCFNPVTGFKSKSMFMWRENLMQSLIKKDEGRPCYDTIMLTRSFLYFSAVDSIKVKGLQKILPLKDSLYYTLYDYGIREYKIFKSGGIFQGKTFYNAQIEKNTFCLSNNGYLFYGGISGAFVLKPGYQPQYIAAESFPSVYEYITYIAALAVALLLLFIFAVLQYRNHVVYNRRSAIISREKETRFKEELSGSIEKIIKDLSSLKDLFLPGEEVYEEIMHLGDCYMEMRNRCANRGEYESFLSHLLNRSIEINKIAVTRLIAYSGTQIKLLKEYDMGEACDRAGYTMQLLDNKEFDKLFLCWKENKLWMRQADFLLKRISDLKYQLNFYRSDSLLSILESGPYANGTTFENLEISGLKDCREYLKVLNKMGAYYCSGSFISVCLAFINERISAGSDLSCLWKILGDSFEEIGTVLKLEHIAYRVTFMKCLNIFYDIKLKCNLISESLEVLSSQSLYAVRNYEKINNSVYSYAMEIRKSVSLFFSTIPSICKMFITEDLGMKKTDNQQTLYFIILMAYPAVPNKVVNRILFRDARDVKSELKKNLRTFHKVNYNKKYDFPLSVMVRMMEIRDI